MDAYLQELNELGVKYTTQGEENHSVTNGYVTRISQLPGVKYNLEEGAEITVYYADNPVETEAPTEAPTETPQTEAPTEAQQTEAQT